MNHEIIMPVLGMNQDTGIIASWLKKPGDFVNKGDSIMEIETDKVVQEIEAHNSGYLSEYLYEEGIDIPVGEVVAYLSEDKNDDIIASKLTDKIKNKVESSKQVNTNSYTEKPTTPDQSYTSQNIKENDQQVFISNNQKILASPKAKKIAQQQNIDLADLLKANYKLPLKASNLQEFITNTSKQVKTNNYHKIKIKINKKPLQKLVDDINQLNIKVNPSLYVAKFIVSSLRYLDIFDTEDIAVNIHSSLSTSTIINPDYKKPISDNTLIENNQHIDADIEIFDFANCPIADFDGIFHATLVVVFSQDEDNILLTLHIDSCVTPAKKSIELSQEIYNRFNNPLKALL